MDYSITKRATRTIAELLEAQTPHAVVSRMAKALRPGKVLVDWSQNTEHKPVVCAYSVRAKQRPTVSTPLHWDEVERAMDRGDAAPLVFEMDEVVGKGFPARRRGTRGGHVPLASGATVARCA